MSRNQRNRRGRGGGGGNDYEPGGDQRGPGGDQRGPGGDQRGPGGDQRGPGGDQRGPARGRGQGQGGGRGRGGRGGGGGGGPPSSFQVSGPPQSAAFPSLGGQSTDFPSLGGLSGAFPSLGGPSASFPSIPGAGQFQKQQQQQQQQPLADPAAGQQQQQHPRGPPRREEFKAETKVHGPSPASGQQEKRKVEEKADVKPKDVTPEPIQAKAASTMDMELFTIPLRRQNADRTAKAGKRIKVDVNHMALKLQNYQIVAYHYDCVFVPDKPKFLLIKAMNEFFRQKFPKRVPVFDGVKNLYSNGPLVPEDRGLSATISVFNEESQREKEFTITIAVVNKINMSDLERYQTNSRVNPQMALTVMDLALRSYSANKLVSSGRKFFSPPTGQVVVLGDGIELWHGHFQAASLGWKPYLCVDVSHKGFYEPYTIGDAITQLFGGRIDAELNDNTRRELESHVKGLRVEYEVPRMANSKRSYRVNGVVGSARNEKFMDDEKKQWTIEQYFAKQKNCPLKFPNMPCLWVGARDKKIRIPGELCRISAGQSYNRKYNEKQTAQMVRAATSNTEERRRHIMNAYGNTGLKDGNPFLREFGISVSGQFERVEGRVLVPPVLEYGNDNVTPDRGVWRAQNFMVPMELSNWAILSLNYRTREDELRNLSKMLAQQGGSCGMSIKPTNDIHIIKSSNNRREIESYFQAQKGKQIVFVCVPDSGDTYAVVKKIAEITVGVLTQCIKGRTLQRINPATIGNILLKVNAKLNGTNHSFTKEVRPKCLSRPVMIVGADVTHPSPGQLGIPSIAAVAASHDPKAFKYNMIWRMQPKGEMIVDLENVMREQLLFFFKSTKHKPEKILFFRDGVSDGEIQKVMSLEIRAIRNACNKLEGGYEPKITFLVVQKRHHTRFFPTDNRDCYDRKNFNLPAGTVVDTEIVHPHETEFLLLSHASILGTARPTKYRLVWDDSEFYENELEQLSYYLCHMFTRCTRSVSYPAPTYYAHLAAFRARSYLEADRINDLNDLPGEQRKRKMNEALMNASPMFFV